MQRKIFAGLILSASLAAVAQTNPPAVAPKRVLTLRQCIDLALSHNLDLQIEHETTDLARYNLAGSYGAWVPTLSFGAREDFVDQPPTFDPKKPGADFPYRLTTDTIGPNLKGRLPFGFNYDLNGVSGNNAATTDFRSVPGTSNNFLGGIRVTNEYFGEASLTVMQHLLRDFWIDADREKLLIERKNLKISQQALRFQIMKTITAVEVAYAALVSAREAVKVQEKALELRQQFVSETQKRVQVGDLPPLDTEQAQTQQQNTLTTLTTAREALGNRQNELKILLTDDLRSWVEVELEPADRLVVKKQEFNRSASFSNALQNRPDLEEARLEIQKRDVIVQYRFNQLFPSLDLLARYGGRAFATNQSSAISDSINLRHPEYFYGAVVSYPLGAVSERNQYRASKSVKKIAELQLKKAEQEIFLEIAVLINRAQSRLAQVESTHQARVYAESALAAEQKKMQNGLTTSFVVLQLQEILTSAANAEINTVSDYNTVLAQLAFAEGSTMEKHHLTLEVK